MKRLLAKSILLAGGMTASSQLLALGLGELDLDSALNQPLKAEIQMIDSAGLTSAEIKPRLASTEDFERAGVERYQFLRQMKFSINGDRIIVTTRDPINEPFLNFLVELNWPAGRVLREYTVLLDPPVFQEETIQPLVAVPAASAVTSRTTSTAPQPAAPTQARPASGNTWSQPAQPGTYKVQPNDTLWQIALETRPNASVTPQQMMIALQDVNPDAFINGNINRLKTHTVLDIPDESIVRTIAQREAVTEVNRQNRELKAAVAQIDATGRKASAGASRGNSTGGEVRLVSASGDGKAGAASGAVSGGTGVKASALENDLAIALENLDKSRRENQELVDRLSSLEEQLAKMERLISLQNDQLANIQLNSAESNAEKAVVATEAPAPAAESKPVEKTTGGTDTAAVAPAPAETPEAAKPAAETAPAEGATDFNYSDGAEKPQVAESQPSEVQSSEQKAAELKARMAEERRKAMEAAAQPKSPLDDIIGTVTSLPTHILGAIAAGILLLIFGLIRLFKGKKTEEEAAESNELADSQIDDSFDNAAMPLFDDKEVADLPTFEENSTENEELVSGGLDDFELHQDDLGEMPVTDDMDELDIGSFDDADGEQYETVGQTEDAISESDIYIAYGKFDQAADLLNKAILAEPERVDLRIKLLEVHSSLDEADKFAAVEAGLIAIGDVDANDKARALRAQLTSPVEPGNVSADLSLDGEIPSLDESADEEFAGGMDFGEALDFGDDVAPEDDGIGASLEEVPELELGERSDFNADQEGVDMSLEEDSLDVDDDLLDFSLDDADESVAESTGLEDSANEMELDSDDLDVADSVEAPLEFAAVNEESTVADSEFDLEFAEDAPVSSADNSELDDLVAFDAGELSLDDDAELTLDDDAEPTLDEEGDFGETPVAAEVSVEADSDIADLADLDAELSDLATNDEAVIEAPEAGSDLDFDLELDATDIADSLDELDADLDLAAEDDDLPEVSAPDVAIDSEIEEFEAPSPVAVDDQPEAPAVADEPVVESESEDVLAEASGSTLDDELNLGAFAADSDESDLIGGIDLDELAAADDEFDFLSGTDECATKLDLARAYIDMEDYDGAKELLSEVVSEGNDQQKQDAQDLLGNLS